MELFSEFLDIGKSGGGMAYTAEIAVLGYVCSVSYLASDRALVV